MPNAATVSGTAYSRRKIGAICKLPVKVRKSQRNRARGQQENRNTWDVIEGGLPVVRVAPHRGASHAFPGLRGPNRRKDEITMDMDHANHGAMAGA